MSDNAEYLIVLVIAIGLTFAVGRQLRVTGKPFLQEVFRDEKVTGSVNRLLSVLFYLVTLGVLAIISAIDFDLASQLQTVVVKLGVVLLVLGIAFGVSLLVLIKVRERRREQQVSEEVDLKLAEQGRSTEPTSQPISELPDPDVAPPVTVAPERAEAERNERTEHAEH